MQTTVQNEKTIRFGSAVIAVNGINIGALQGAKLNVEESVLTLVADNAKLKPRKKVTKATVMADLWEINLDTLALLDGCGTLVSIPGSSTPVTAEVLRASGSWASNEVLFFANAQGDGSVAASIVLKNGATTLTAGTDYAIVIVNGKTGVARIGSALTLTGIGLNVGYSYTPNVKKTYSALDIIKLVELFSVDIYNIDEDGKKLGIKFNKAYNSKGIEWSFTPDDKLDEVMKYPVELTAFPDSGNKLFEIYDEQAV